MVRDLKNWPAALEEVVASSEPEMQDKSRQKPPKAVIVSAKVDKRRKLYRL